jgi:hypothetical protein
MSRTAVSGPWFSPGPTASKPTLPHRTREGWGNPILKTHERLGQPPPTSSTFRRQFGWTHCRNLSFPNCPKVQSPFSSDGSMKTGVNGIQYLSKRNCCNIAVTLTMCQ